MAVGRIDDEASRAGSRAWIGVCTVGIAVFSLVTSELFPVGVLSAISADLGTSTGVTGLIVTVPGLVAAVSAPLVAVYAGRFDSRVVLALLVALVGLSNLATAFAPNLATVLAARVAVGIGVGGFWALAAGIAPRLVPHTRVPLATAVVFGGISAASVLGVPATAQLSSALGWRAGSATIAAVAAAVALAVLLLVPALPADPGQRDRESGSLWAAVRRTRLVLVVTMLVVVGQFAAFTFVSPILQSVAGVAESDVPRVLFAYGIAGMTGNFLAGRFVAGSPRKAVQLIAATITVALSIMLTVDVGPAPATGLMILWGLAFGASSVSLQLWLLQVSGRHAQLATSASVSVFNVGIAVGSALGGLAIDKTGSEISALGVAVAVLLVAALAASVRPARPVADNPDAGARSGAT
jgi:predicted MFS family arabinose efflux permease